MVTVLAIDPGYNFGYAFLSTEIDNKLVEYGDYLTHIKGVTGEVSHKNSLETIMAEYDPDFVVVEDVVKGSNTMQNWQAVWSTVGVQYLVSQLVRHKVSYKPISAMTLKAYVRKRLGLPGKTKIDKKVVIGYVNDTYGTSLKLKDNNAADAIALGECFLANIKEYDVPSQ